ncbi:GH116 family glycosyl hydrolase [Sulfurisphaera javensis]|uniref:GH116 family glycosyl hydrolase n=1 Tax=Sulfurisphaera javensis TaxID=2049879 RepID=A0AAT9GMM2_9CREN
MNGIPIGSIGTGKIEFFPDLTIDNVTIMNNWSNPRRSIRGFHIVKDGIFLQTNPGKNIENPPEYRKVKKIISKEKFPIITYEIPEVNTTVTVFSIINKSLKDSSLPAIVFHVKGEGVFAISFPNLVGSRREGRENYAIKRKINGVLFTNEKALQQDPAYGNMFLGCIGCKVFAGYSYLRPSRKGMTEDITPLLELRESDYYKIEPYAREEIAGIVWKEVHGEEKFILSWYFNGRPYNYPYGHYYENWFNNSYEVAEYVLLNDLKPELEDEDSWINEVYRDGLYVLTYSWLTKDGRFAVYEDPEVTLLMNTIGTMTYDAVSFALLELYPDLVKKMDEYFGLFLRNGEVPHDLGEESIESPIYGASSNYPWTDLASTWVLMMYRDYKFTNDLDFLKRNYEKMKEAIDYLLSLDKDKDCIPDSKGGLDNSYDGTYMFGASSYVASMFLCALRAFISASKILGKDSSNYEDCLRKGMETYNSLFNGKYFIAWKSSNTKKESCMSSQLLGQFWCELLSLEPIADEEKIISALKSIYELNYKASKYCLVNSVNPDGSIDTETDQMRSCWSRVAFAVSAHMILKGLKEEGLEIAKREWETIKSLGVWNQSSRIDAITGKKVGLPYYIGSVSPWFIKYAIKLVNSVRNEAQ